MRFIILISLLSLNALAEDSATCLYDHFQNFDNIEQLNQDVEATVDYENNKHDYALFDAVKNCDEKKISKAIKKGANVNAMNSAYNKQTDRYTPLITAIRRNCQVAVDLLIAANADVNLDHGISGNAPIMIAARWGRTDAIKSLLKVNSIDVNNISSVGRTAIIVASSYDHKEIVELLVNRKDLDLQKSSIFDNSATAIGVAARQNHLDVLKTLVNHADDIRPITQKQIEGALNKARVNKHLEAEKMLLEYKEKHYK